PAHYARRVRDALNELDPNKWIGRGGLVPRPLRSPDLTPNMVDREPTTAPENIKERIHEACSVLAPETIQSAVSSLINRLYQCIKVNGHLR
ncbi:hypothetical protein WN55_01330, partial [Dufourea novaeangliae]